MRLILSHLPNWKPTKLTQPVSKIISHQIRKMATNPTFSSNYDPQKGAQELSPLLRTNGGKWDLIESGKGVERSFKFKTFKKTWVSSL